MQIRGDLLFNNIGYHQFTAQRLHAALEEVASFTENYVLNTSDEDLISYLQQKHSLDVPTLQTDEIYVLDQGEDRVPIQGHVSYDWGRRNQLFVAGRVISYAVPFVGDHKLLRVQPPEFSSNPPQGFVEEGVVKFEYFIQAQDSSEAILSNFQQYLGELQRSLSSMSLGAGVFNNQLLSEIRQKLADRKQKILKERNLVSALGFPIRKRSDTPLTFAAPVQRRRLQMAPSASAQPFQPEPTLPIEEYDHILDIIKRMTLVMERSPRAFATMDEESLRTHFLVQLNGHYEGQATGETFNLEGKTDILIRVDNQNIFIAECKIWGGPSTLSEAIDQILGYLSWRDTKAAIVLFSHNKDFSAVVNQVPGIVKSHPNCKRQLASQDETSCRFILGQKKDINREITLTVLCFHVPIPD